MEAEEVEDLKEKLNIYDVPPKEPPKKRTIKMSKDELILVCCVIFLLAMLLTLWWKYNGLVDAYQLLYEHCGSPVYWDGMGFG